MPRNLPAAVRIILQFMSIYVLEVGLKLRAQHVDDAHIHCWQGANCSKHLHRPGVMARYSRCTIGIKHNECTRKHHTSWSCRTAAGSRRRVALEGARY